MIPIHSKMRIVEREWNERPHSSLSREGRSQFLLLNREVKSEEIYSVNGAEQCLEKENQQSGNGYGRAVRS